MRGISQIISASAVFLLFTGAVAQAHGLHPEVPPQSHAAVHVLQLVGVVALAIGIGVWVERRTRARRR